MDELVPTAEQLPIIDYPGSLVAIAKPGSGKTFVLAQKIRRLLDSLPAFRGVIAISYTNKASDELRRRASTNGVNVKASFFGTIDKFCWGEIVIPFLPHLWGKPAEPATIYRIKDLEEDEAEPFADVEEDAFSLEEVESHLEVLKTSYQQGRLYLETCAAMALYVVANSVAARRYLVARFSHIIIDEYQDSGQEQHLLLQRIRELGLVAVAVGDADQSIYGFSGKDSKYLLSLAGDPNFQLFPITLNHRSHPSIINYSLRFLDPNAALLPAPETRVFLKSCIGHHAAIAEWIDAQLPAIMAQFGAVKRSEIAVLVRSNASGERIAQSLATPNHHWESHPLEEHFSLWSRLFARLLSYRYNEAITAEEVIQDCSVQLTPDASRRVRKMIRGLRAIPEGALYDALEAIATALLPKARKQVSVDLLRGSTPADYTRCFRPGTDNEIQVMSLHKSKGLEFDIVFHLDLYAFVLPFQQPGPGNDWDNPVFPSLSQDRNLHYVGITRARKACFLCTSTRRLNAEGVVRQGTPSRFLAENGLPALRLVSPS